MALWPSNTFIVRADVKVAVNIEQIQIPIMIQHIAKARPSNVRGARSPYLYGKGHKINGVTQEVSKRIIGGYPAVH